MLPSSLISRRKFLKETFLEKLEADSKRIRREAPAWSLQGDYSSRFPLYEALSLWPFAGQTATYP